MLDAHRPPPPPVFKTPGMADVYAAGLEARLVPPERHLALLHGVYAGRYGNLPPVVTTSFPPAPDSNLSATPEQEDGAAALVFRLEAVRLAFLADSVGLGKTLTALGTAWQMKKAGLVVKVALIAPRKLWSQWERDANTFGLPWDMLRLVNRHVLERDEPEQAAARLDDADLLIVEEAHESLRSRNNRLWVNLRRYLAARPGCRILLVSATPWNNRREDIFNYLLLAWQDGRPLEGRYPGLRDLGREMTCFGELAPARGARWFEELGADTGYRRLFDATFVQRTRSMLARHYGSTGFPLRKPLALQTPLSPAHDALFAALTTALGELNLPYREPMRAFLRAAAPEDAPGLGNFQKSLLLQLFKRAESSTFALAVSLANTARQLAAFRAELAAVAAAEHPADALIAWVRARVGAEEDEDEDLSGLSSSEQGCATQLLAVLRAGDDDLAANIVHTVLTEQIEPDRRLVDELRSRVTFELDARSPKELQLYRQARDAYEAGHKPILVAAYADSAVRMFLRLVAQLPDATIALALGADEAWVSTPTEHTRLDVTPDEWSQALDLAPRERRLTLFRGLVDRANPAVRELILDRFAPRARGHTLAPDGHIDVLVGSEAISIGQNLQDSTTLIQLDLPWNPMVIEQRIGRIDRRGGGRPDPGSPGGQPIVDVVYCWSSEAVDRAVKLRDRLVKKATGALSDTRFDELLLDELHAQVMAKRAVNGESFLEVQRRATQRASGGAGTGSEIDALRQLAAWASGRDVAAEPPVVAGGLSGPGGWLLTLEATAKGPRGEVLGTFRRSCGADTAVPAIPAADLELVVRRLLSGVSRRDTDKSRRAWTVDCLALDAALATWANRTRVDHNAEVDRHDAARLATATPNEKLRTLLGGAAAKVREVGGQMEKDPALRAILHANKCRIDFLMKDVLVPSRVHELLAHGQDEERARNALETIQLVPRDFLTARFDEVFDELCGARWAARIAASTPQPALLAAGLDGRWQTLDVRVLAATWCAP